MSAWLFCILTHSCLVARRGGAQLKQAVVGSDNKGFGDVSHIEFLEHLSAIVFHTFGAFIHQSAYCFERMSLQGEAKHSELVAGEVRQRLAYPSSGFVLVLVQGVLVGKTNHNAFCAFAERWRDKSHYQ